MNIVYRFAILFVILVVLSGCSSINIGYEEAPNNTGSVYNNGIAEESTPGINNTEVISSSPTPALTPTPTLLAGSTLYSGTIEDFILSIKNNDAESLRRMISPSGFTVIRNFYSGFGNRGKDIRNLYSFDEIPDDLQFEVIDEIPVTLHDFFEKTQQGEVSDIPVTQIIDCNFNFTDDVETKSYGPPTEEVRDLCSDLTSDYSPRIFELEEREVVLTESSLINYTPIGVWAVFEKYDDQYLLRAVIDLR